MTSARLQRMTCPRCLKDVAFRLVGEPHVHAGQLIPGIRVPVAHHNQLGEPCKPRERP